MTDQDDRVARKGRQAGLVIACAAGFWMLANYLGPRYGVPVKFAILADLAALAAFAWALIVTFQMWRERQGK